VEGFSTTVATAPRCSLNKKMQLTSSSAALRDLSSTFPVVLALEYTSHGGEAIIIHCRLIQRGMSSI
jgi:hypothetical protein